MHLPPEVYRVANQNGINGKSNRSAITGKSFKHVKMYIKFGVLYCSISYIKY